MRQKQLLTIIVLSFSCINISFASQSEITKSIDTSHTLNKSKKVTYVSRTEFAAQTDALYKEIAALLKKQPSKKTVHKSFLQERGDIRSEHTNLMSMLGYTKKNR